MLGSTPSECEGETEGNGESADSGGIVLDNKGSVNMKRHQKIASYPFKVELTSVKQSVDGGASARFINQITDIVESRPLMSWAFALELL